jgi:hypothetical protein
MYFTKEGARSKSTEPGVVCRATPKNRAQDMFTTFQRAAVREAHRVAGAAYGPRMGVERALLVAEIYWRIMVEGWMGMPTLPGKPVGGSAQ